MKNRKRVKGARGRRGFTLTELVIATALTAVVMSQAGVALVSAQRMFESTFADIELSLQSRALREKLLYRINDDGGLMNACQAGLALVNVSTNKGKGIVFTPSKGTQNKVMMSDGKKLVADLVESERWLECGTMVFQGDNVFGLSATNGMIEVTLDMAIPISTRKYQQRSLVKAQVMNQ